MRILHLVDPENNETAEISDDILNNFKKPEVVTCSNVEQVIIDQNLEDYDYIVCDSALRVDSKDLLSLLANSKIAPPVLINEAVRESSGESARMNVTESLRNLSFEARVTIYQDVIDNLPMQILIVNRLGLITFVNKACSAYLGCENGNELVGQPILRIFTPSLASDIVTDLRRYLATDSKPASQKRATVSDTKGNKLDSTVQIIQVAQKAERHLAVIFLDKAIPDIESDTESKVSLLAIHDSIADERFLANILSDSNNETTFVANTDALESLSHQKFDMAVYSVTTHNTHSVAQVKNIKNVYPDMPIIVAAITTEQQSMKELLQEEVEGVILSETEFANLPDAIDHVSKGANWYSAGVVKMVASMRIASGNKVVEDKILTRREREILGYVASGLKNQDIADHLGLKFRTVVTHIYNIYKKLDIKNRSQAVLYAIDHGLADK